MSGALVAPCLFELRAQRQKRGEWRIRIRAGFARRRRADGARLAAILVAPAVAAIAAAPLVATAFGSRPFAAMTFAALSGARPVLVGTIPRLGTRSLAVPVAALFAMAMTIPVAALLLRLTVRFHGRASGCASG